MGNIYGAVAGLGRATEGDTLTFTTPDNQLLQTKISRINSTASGNRLVESQGANASILAVINGDGNFVAAIKHGEDRYQSHIIQNRTVVYSGKAGELVENPFFGDALTPDLPLPQNLRHRTLSNVRNAPARITVGIQYDDATQSAYDPIAEAELAIEVANRSYQAAGIEITFEIVGIRNYEGYVSQTDMADTLYYLTFGTTTPSTWSPNADVQNWRDEVKADLVVQIVRWGVVSGLGTTCGIAWMPSSDDLLSQDLLPFMTNSVNALESPLGYSCSDVVVAHEMGHNLGLAHDRSTSPDSNPYFSYARGYKNSSFGTVMSYTSNYIHHISNPNVLYAGQATGVPVGNADEAHAALAVENIKHLHQAIYDNPRNFLVTAQAGPGGHISPGSLTVPEGATATFTVTADTGFSLEAITGCGGTLAGSEYTTGAVTSNCTVTATFQSLVVCESHLSQSVWLNLPVQADYNCSSVALNLAGESGPSNFIAFSNRDSDSDGVPDTLDDCPSTGGEQHEINENGCLVTLPGTPSIIKHEPGDGEIQLFVSVYDGGADNVYYEAVCTDGTNTFTELSYSSPIIVSGLTNGVAYTCTVTATNSVGTSSASAATDPITPEATATGLPIWLLYQATQ